ncbi:hypothetical protein PoB_003624200 [Plakobranchus ocellatus]|uniref:Uncharacterized protein n=1 Tax=Plakobranchus ocellatus TaxID=259542 RepID=A0AAV4AS19_9GAST|nr:hypothetical protein PoB_003624200 [Plakobranchus ocellatus]
MRSDLFSVSNRTSLSTESDLFTASSGILPSMRSDLFSVSNGISPPTESDLFTASSGILPSTKQHVFSAPNGISKESAKINHPSDWLLAQRLYTYVTIGVYIELNDSEPCRHFRNLC